MLTLQECLDFLDLTETEIHSIARHERIPEIVAAGRSIDLLQSRDGVRLIKRYMLEDIEHARSQGRHEEADRLHSALHRLDAIHPTPDPV